MAYITQRINRFYVVAYDGLDPVTGKERRRWHPAGTHRHEAKQIAAREGQSSRQPVEAPVDGTPKTQKTGRLPVERTVVMTLSGSRLPIRPAGRG